MTDRPRRADDPLDFHDPQAPPPKPRREAVERIRQHREAWAKAVAEHGAEWAEEDDREFALEMWRMGVDPSNPEHHLTPHQRELMERHRPQGGPPPKPEPEVEPVVVVRRVGGRSVVAKEDDSEASP